MKEYIGAFLLLLENSFTAFIGAVIILCFPLAAGIAITAIIARLVKAEAETKSLILYGFIFSVFGLAVAYLYSENKSDTFSQILPPSIGAVVIIFQMLGRLNPKWDVPLDTQASLTGATAGVFCFIFGSIYFDFARVGEDASSSVDTSFSADVPSLEMDNQPLEEPLNTEESEMLPQ